MGQLGSMSFGMPPSPVSAPPTHPSTCDHIDSATVRFGASSQLGGLSLTDSTKTAAAQYPTTNTPTRFSLSAITSLPSSSARSTGFTKRKGRIA